MLNARTARHDPHLFALPINVIDSVKRGLLTWKKNRRIEITRSLGNECYVKYVDLRKIK
jgi:hypothetical protein